MKEQFIKLLHVRSLITLVLTGALVYGFVVNKIESKDFLVYVTMVFTFYFAKEQVEKIKKDYEEKSDKGVG